MKLLLPLLFLVSTGVAQAQSYYFGSYIGGKKTGYTYNIDEKVDLDGKPAIKTVSHWESVELVGGLVDKFVTDSTAWSTLDNRPIRDVTKRTSGGEVSVITVEYTEKTVEMDVEERGKKTHKSVPLPDGPVYADTVKAIHAKAPNPGDKFTFWYFESMPQAFTKVDVRTVGPTEYVQGGKKATAMLSIATVEGGSLRFFTNSRGEMVHEEFPMDLVLHAESAEEAKAGISNGSDLPDMLEVTSLKMDGTVDDPLKLKSLKIRVSGEDLSKLPSDTNQTITKDGDGWIVDVHPARISQSGKMSIEEAAKGYEKFTEPARYLTSDDPKIRALATKLTAKSKSVADAAVAIRKYVNKSMKPEMMLGAPRDATEVLQDQRGKCTDYAILYGALMRAAGIPTRLCAGLITAGDAFYYHAWNEFWDGKRWVEIDAVFDTGTFSACHIKLAQGDAEESVAIHYWDPKGVAIHLIGSKH